MEREFVEQWKKNKYKVHMIIYNMKIMRADLFEIEILFTKDNIILKKLLSRVNILFNLCTN